MIRTGIVLFFASATPVYAASGPFFSLRNTDFVVLISFVVFVGVIIYLKAPQFVGKLLDRQISDIRNQIDRASNLRAEATEALFEAKREAIESEQQAKLIVEHANVDAKRQVEIAEIRIKEAGERRIQAAKEQIDSAENAARNAVNKEAIEIAMETAAKQIISQMTKAERNCLTEQAINEIKANIS